MLFKICLQAWVKNHQSYTDRHTASYIYMESLHKPYSELNAFFFSNTHPLHPIHHFVQLFFNRRKKIVADDIHFVARV